MAQTTSSDPQTPRHVAIIMDGNGRWAGQRGLPRLRGHERGVEAVRGVVRASREQGVKYLTLYAFSVENWVRPPGEISGLMQLLARFLREREVELHENRVRLRVMGRVSDLPGLVRKPLDRVCRETAEYDSGQLILALSYGGRAEIADAARAIAVKVKDGTLDADQIDESTIREHLYLPDVPDPDLVIRTSGELRLSNFLLWQASYAEIYVTDVLWPDFGPDDLKEAIEAYAKRHRRFGGVDEKQPDRERSSC